MELTREAVSSWLQKYVRAWETYDPALIGDLFTEDADYSFFPFDEPVRGRQAIVKSWVEDQDQPGTYTAEYHPIAVDGDTAVAQGRSLYYEDSTRSKLARQYDNIFVLRFGEDGRCRSFKEWYMRPRGQKEPTAG